MKLGRRRSRVESSPGESLSSRRWNDPFVLLALAAIMAGVASLALLLSDGPPGDDSPEAGFARDMAIHHAQAVQMAETARERTEDPAIRVVATDIVLTQQAEIGQMRGWLEAWGLSASSPEPQMAWMGHPTTGPMPGMASPEDLARLQQASSKDVDEQFLRLMIPHHQAAIPMAQAVLERSDRPEVQRFAQKTVLSQQAEIRGMQALLQREGLSAEDSGTSLDPAGEHTDHDGQAHDLIKTLRDTARLAPLPLAALAAAWLGLDAICRRARTGLAETLTPSILWRMVAVGGLVASALLHVGLAPIHFEEATAQGVFFVAAGITSAIIAAAVLAWPSRPVYAAAAGISLALILLWAAFRLLPPPGAETAEVVDLVGLFTKATELVAIVACAVLWSRSNKAPVPGSGVHADPPLDSV